MRPEWRNRGPWAALRVSRIPRSPAETRHARRRSCVRKTTPSTSACSPRGFRPGGLGGCSRPTSSSRRSESVSSRRSSRAPPRSSQSTSHRPSSSSRARATPDSTRARRTRAPSRSRTARSISSFRTRPSTTSSRSATCAPRCGASTRPRAGRPARAHARQRDESARPAPECPPGVAAVAAPPRSVPDRRHMRPSAAPARASRGRLRGGSLARGHALPPACSLERLRRSIRAGLPENRAAVADATRAGYRPRGGIGYVGRGRWRGTFRTDLNSFIVHI